MKKITAIALICFTYIISISTVAQAEWRSLGPISTSIKVPTDQKCNYRLKLSYANPAMQDNYFYPDSIRQFINDQGKAYSLSLSTSIGYSDISSLASAGLFIGNINLSNLYQSANGRPFGEKLSALVGSTISQVTVSYSFANQNQGGQIYNTTHALKAHLFTLEESCPASPISKQNSLR